METKQNGAKNQQTNDINPWERQRTVLDSCGLLGLVTHVPTKKRMKKF